MTRSKNFIPNSVMTNMKPLKYPDCVHLTENCRCSILKVSECIGTKCTFCKTSFEHIKSSGQWNQKMNELQEENQKKIALIYYNGKMPWKPKDRKEG